MSPDGKGGAMEEIKKALSKSGKLFKINFVIVLRAGRVVFEDVQTINQVHSEQMTYSSSCVRYSFVSLVLGMSFFVN